MTKMRKCEICGQPTAEADFSKSYKNRCRSCVAELTRERRAEQKEQASTSTNRHDAGEAQAATATSPDWEQRRYEIAKEIYTQLLSHPDGDVRHYVFGHLKDTATECVMEADTLIAELRKGGSQ